jgi:uncharacterized protein YpbB
LVKSDDECIAAAAGIHAFWLKLASYLISQNRHFQQQVNIGLIVYLLYRIMALGNVETDLTLLFYLLHLKLQALKERSATSVDFRPVVRDEGTQTTVCIIHCKTLI